MKFTYTPLVHLIKKYMLNEVSDFKRIWDFVGGRDFAQEKLFYFFKLLLFIGCFFFFDCTTWLTGS